MNDKLKSRIASFLSEVNKSANEVSLQEVIVHLQDAYPEYRRLSRSVLKRAVLSHLKLLQRIKESDKKIQLESAKSASANDSLIDLYGTGDNADKLSNQVEKLPSKSSIDVKKSDSQTRKFSVSHSSFTDVGGQKSVLRKLCQFVLHSQESTLYRKYNIISSNGLMISGPGGCGKTLMAQAISGEFSLPMTQICCPELVGNLSGETESNIRKIFQEGKAQAPCLLLFDDIESILGKRDGASKQMEQRVVTQFASCLDELSDWKKSPKNSSVLVIGTTCNSDRIDPALRRAGRFDSEISLGMPSVDERQEILSIICRDVPVDSQVSLESLAQLTPGFLGSDLKAFVREAALNRIVRIFSEVGRKESPYGPEYAMLKEFSSEDISQLLSEDNCSVMMVDFNFAVKKVQPSSKREGFVTVPSVTWDDVGALHEIRKELQFAILYPVKHHKLYKEFNLSSPSGTLLAGPPGCGKTLLAKAVANEAGINFISVKGPELLNMYLGESERAVRQVFTRAKNSSPCVIFFDEIDALCPKRKDSDHGSKVVQQFLTELDGVEGREGVFVLAATNRPDVIDSAILRPGRFDKILHVGVPSAEDRLDILKAITQNGTKPRLSDDVSLESVANSDNATDFTGADLAALVREASVISLQEILSSGSLPKDSEETVQACVVSKRHFDQAFLQVSSSLSKEYNSFESHSKKRRFESLGK